ncbi:MAG: hypothetical protein WB760_06255 [Xanthobacteraceae bacterium]
MAADVTAQSHAGEFYALDLKLSRAKLRLSQESKYYTSIYKEFRELADKCTLAASEHKCYKDLKKETEDALDSLKAARVNVDQLYEKIRLAGLQLALAVTLPSGAEHEGGTGAPGRPSKGMHLIEAEFDRRSATGTCRLVLGEEADALLVWFRAHYPELQPPSPKTIKNRLGKLHRQMMTSRAGQICTEGAAARN